MGEVVPRSQLSRQAMVGTGALGGGVALLALAGNSVFSIVAGAVLLVVGLALSTARSDRTVGIVCAAVGALSVVIGIFPRLTALAWLMRGSGIVLIGGGIYLLARFFLNLRKRS